MGIWKWHKEEPAGYQIRRKQYKIPNYPEYKEMARRGYQITLECDNDIEDDDGNEALWYCSMYLGDSNGPHKVGTISGCGYGMSQLEAYERAIDSLEIVYKEKK